MFHRSKNLKYVLNLVPGKRRLGTYRFLPIFFCIGGVMEWIMINVRIGKETFCDRLASESTCSSSKLVTLLV
uniref:Ubiquinol-cytochrome c reductase complex assembly factor 5 n=1 Tax=Seriola lalandi dorsalis TaxID=1841481 RepID=A0A3B4X2W5_SERLL